MLRSKFKLAAVFLLFGSLPACNRGDAEVARGSRARIVDSSGGTVALGIGKSSYRASANGTGAVTGTVSLEGVPAADSTIAVTRDQRVCGDTAELTETSGINSSLANALVWVDGISTGKPLPDMRRQTLTIVGCHFEPRVMGVVTKSTINVFSRDRVTHGPEFFREGAAAPVERIHTVDAGQVVPTEKIAAQPGLVEVRCAEHPFARGYIAVFDHPYFAVTDDHGAFTIDGLPPGTYTVKVWHERMAKPTEQRVVVGPGGAGRLDVQVALK